MPRTYNATVVLPPAPKRSPLRVVEADRIPKNAQLVDVVDASVILTKKFGKGFSVPQIYRYVKSDWNEGVHFIRFGKGKRPLLKIYIDGVVDWVINPQIFE